VLPIVAATRLKLKVAEDDAAERRAKRKVDGVKVRGAEGLWLMSLHA
jgi:hypothetical protein